MCGKYQGDKIRKKLSSFALTLSCIRVMYSNG
nr:MAG TPA: hypothetical protein [Caudoviricetes sp.]